jgi:hypothetical protein
MTYSFAILRVALRSDGCSARRTAAAVPTTIPAQVASDDIMARLDALLFADAPARRPDPATGSGMTGTAAPQRTRHRPTAPSKPQQTPSTDLRAP